MRVLIWTAGLVGLFLVAWNWWLYPSYTIRYRLMVEVQDGDQVRTGSSVIEAEYGWQPKILAQPGGWGEVRGEATFVDLGDGRNLVVTLTNEASGRPPTPGEATALDALSLPLFAFNIRPDKQLMAEEILEARKIGAADVPLSRLPTTVTFRKLDDPKSIELVLPDAIERTLPGVSIRRVTVEITDDPIDEKIEQRLTWLKRPDLLKLLLFPMEKHVPSGSVRSTIRWAFKTEGLPI